MKRLQLIRQHDEKDCGAACTSMIFNYFGRKLPLSVLREEIKVDQNGASIYGLKKCAEKNGMICMTYQADPETVWECMKNNDISFPAVIRIVNRYNFEHYVVVKSYKKGRLEIYDPGEGRYTMPYELFCGCFLGQILTYKKSNNFTQENLCRHQYKRFFALLSKQKKLVACIGFLSMIITVIGMSGSLIFKILIDQVIPAISNEEALDRMIDGFALLITGALIMYIFKSITEILRGRLLNFMSRNIDLPLMLGYSEHVLEMPMNFFDTRKNGEITSRFSDASKIRDAVSGVTLTMFIDVAMVLICGAFMFYQSAELFSVTALIFLIYMVLGVIYIKPMNRFNNDFMEKGAQISSYLKEVVDGIGTIKSTQSEGKIMNKINTMLEGMYRLSRKGSMMTITKGSLSGLFTSVGTLVFLWIGALSVISGNLTLGGLISCFTLMGYVLNPVQNLVDMQSTIQTALVAADRLNDVLALEPEKKTGTALSEEIETVSMEKITFGYGNRRTVIKDMNTEIKRGESIAFVGESGSGKTTVANLLSAYYIPETGSVKINGIPTSELNLDDYRKQISYVSQTTYLFNDTVRNNVLLGLKDNEVPSDDEIDRILKLCCCDFVDRLPMGIDTMLEENGSNLSGGQKQKLAIARALLRNPKMLILDEATSALDSISEYSIQKSLETEYPDLTMIIIAHRLSTVKNCDRIIVMKDGKIIETGSHNDLLDMGMHYSELWKKQNPNAA